MDLDNPQSTIAIEIAARARQALHDGHSRPLALVTRRLRLAAPDDLPATLERALSHPLDCGQLADLHRRGAEAVRLEAIAAIEQAAAAWLEPATWRRPRPAPCMRGCGHPARLGLKTCRRPACAGERKALRKARKAVLREYAAAMAKISSGKQTAA